MTRPINELYLVNYLQLSEIDEINSLIRILMKIEIFDKKSRWFRHNLIKKCFEDILTHTIKTYYHETASNFYKDQVDRIDNTISNFQASYNLRKDYVISFTVYKYFCRIV